MVRLECNVDVGHVASRRTTLTAILYTYYIPKSLNDMRRRVVSEGHSRKGEVDGALKRACSTESVDRQGQGRNGLGSSDIARSFPRWP